MINRMNDDNKYFSILFNKPELPKNKSLFKRIKYHFQEREYFRTKVKTIIDKWDKDYPDWIDLCEFSDFIRLLEKSMFYNNNLRKAEDDYELIDKLTSDNPIDGSGDKKYLVLELQKEKVCIIFTMHDSNDRWIVDVKIQYYGGKKLAVQFSIDGSMQYDDSNGDTVVGIGEVIGGFESKADWLMLKNAQDRCRDAMKKLFVDYYNKM